MARQYTIKQGDTLSEIALREKTDIKALQELNPGIKDVNKIYAGATLSLPDNVTTSILDDISTSGISSSDTIRNKEQLEKESLAMEDKKIDDELVKLEKIRKINEMKGIITPTIGKPERDSSEETYTRLRSEEDASGMSILDYEMQLSENRKKRAAVASEFEKYAISAEYGQPQSAVTARKTEKGRIANVELGKLDTEAAIIQQRIANRDNVIGMVMKFRKEDYATAMSEYETQYKNNVEIYKLLGTEEDRVRDDARANLQVIMNQIKDGASDYTSLDQSTKAMIRTLELQGGLPQGYISSIMSTKPNVKPIAIRDGVDDDGNSTVSFIYEDANGNPSIVKTVMTGVKKSGGDNDAELYDTLKLEAGELFDEYMSSEDVEYIPLDIYKEARNKAPVSFRDNFDTAFSSLLSKDDRERIGIIGKNKPTSKVTGEVNALVKKYAKDGNISSYNYNKIVSLIELRGYTIDDFSDVLLDLTISR